MKKIVLLLLLTITQICLCATTWYAQTGSGNMSTRTWNDQAGGGGSTLTWANLATDDTLDSNGQTGIVVDVSVECSVITTGSSGGGFSIATGGWTNRSNSSYTVTVDAATGVYSTSPDVDLTSYFSVGDYVWVQGLDEWQNNGFKLMTAVTAGTFTVDLTFGIAPVDETHTGAGVAWGHSGIVIEADITAGTTTCLALTISSGDAVLVIGDTSGGSGSSAYGCYNTSTGQIYNYGTVDGGGGDYSYGCRNNSSGQIYNYSTVTGGSGSSAYGCYNTATGQIYNYETVCGGSGSYAYGCRNSSTGQIYNYGTMCGGSGSDAYGCSNSSTGQIYNYGNIINETDKAQACINRGSYVGGAVIWQPASSSNYIQYPDGAGGTIKAYAETYIPDASDVKAGVDNGTGEIGTYRGKKGAVYGNGIYTNN